MSGNGLRSDHPVDALPEYARGASPDAEEIERHLARCEECRAELGILRALAAEGPPPLTDFERRTAYRAFEARRAGVPGARSGVSWLTTTWRTAAGIALVLTSVAVWRAVEGGPAVSDWNPEPALEGFVDDLADLDVRGREVGALLGAGLLDDPAAAVGAWESMEGAEAGDLAVPWEVER